MKPGTRVYVFNVYNFLPLHPVFALKKNPVWILRTDPTEQNPTVQIPSQNGLEKTVTEEGTIPSDSELQELTEFNMLHHSDLGNPIVVDEDFFQIANL